MSPRPSACHRFNDGEWWLPQSLGLHPEDCPHRKAIPTFNLGTYKEEDFSSREAMAEKIQTDTEEAITKLRPCAGCINEARGMGGERIHSTGTQEHPEHTIELNFDNAETVEPNVAQEIYETWKLVTRHYKEPTRVIVEFERLIRDMAKES